MSDHEKVDLVIVGSGYGGAVMAARLAGTRGVVLIERGRRWAAGDFPDGVLGLVRSYQRPGGGGRGLWGLRIGEGVGNVYASAYGGGSVVNYGITARPDDHVFAGWPVGAAELAPYFEKALGVLGPTPNPRAAALGDVSFLDRVEPGRREQLANTIDWTKCVDCGNCVLGCRHDAKRSLGRTYLALAESRGAQVRTETTVVGIVPEPGGGYRLTLRRTGASTLRFGGGRPATETLIARELVLAAGTFGTLDLLLALRPRVPLSPKVGERMSMNGDSLALLYGTAIPTGGESGAPVSAAVRTQITGPDGLPRTLTIMSGRIPKAVMTVSGWAMAALIDVLSGPHLDGVGPLWRRVRDVLGPSPEGALARTFLYKLDGQDEARGRLGIDAHGRAVMDWPDYGQDPILRFAAEKLDDWTKEVGGRRIRDLGTYPGMRHFGVHPLGGASMGRSFYDGVADSTGRVYKPGGGFHAGLRIVDGSLLPGALGVPPSLCIAALAERCAEAALAGE